MKLTTEEKLKRANAALAALTDTADSVILSDLLPRRSDLGKAITTAKKTLKQTSR